MFFLILIINSLSTKQFFLGKLQQKKGRGFIAFYSYKLNVCSFINMCDGEKQERGGERDRGEREKLRERKKGRGHYI